MCVIFNENPPHTETQKPYPISNLPELAQQQKIISRHRKINLNLSQH